MTFKKENTTLSKQYFQDSYLFAYIGEFDEKKKGKSKYDQEENVPPTTKRTGKT